MGNLKKRLPVKKINFWLFLAPAFVTFTVIIVIPFIMGIWYSFTDWSSSARTGDDLKYVGFENYISSLKDPGFIYSSMITTMFAVLNALVINGVALGLALLVTSKIRLRKVYRAGFFIPYLIGGIILGYIWQFFLNNALPAFGKVFAAFSYLADPDNLVLSRVSSAALAMVFVNTWKFAGYFMMIYIAALESIPVELEEASRIDGASSMQNFIHIALPMMTQAFTVTLFLTLLGSFKEFDVNISLTGGGPSTMFMGRPIFGTQLFAMNIYNTAFVANNLAAAQARAVIFFVVIGIISIFQVRATKKREVEL